LMRKPGSVLMRTSGSCFNFFAEGTSPPSSPLAWVPKNLFQANLAAPVEVLRQEEYSRDDGGRLRIWRRMDTPLALVSPPAWRRLVSLAAAGLPSSNTSPHRSRGRSGAARMHVYGWVCHLMCFLNMQHPQRYR
jgi:hypothetical protein